MRLVVGALLFLVVGCGSQNDSLSELNYRLGASSYAGLTRKVEQDLVRICFSGTQNVEAHKRNVTYSVLKWIAALRDVAPVPLASNVEIVGSNAECDAKVYVGNYNPARASMGGKPSIYLNSTGWYGSLGVTLHEFGHAFGLLDTYSGRGGSCQAGQPDSVMCRASYEELKADDVAGIRKMYEMVSKGLMGSRDPSSVIFFD